jgi:hypothetical protein
MRLRVLHLVCCVCVYLDVFKFAFYKASFRYASMLIHGMLYLDGQVNCKKVCEWWSEGVAHQRLIDCLNHGHIDLNAVNTTRIEHLLPFAMQHPQNRQDLLKEYLLFSIDPSDFKKYKNTRMQGVHYTRDNTGGYKAQTFVMSSMIYGQSCIPFKKILYWGKKGVPKGRQLSKNRIYLKLATKAEQVDSGDVARLAVFDGAGCNRTVLPYFHKSPAWVGFVCKFPRVRNIVTANTKQHIRAYLSNLTQEDFTCREIAGEQVWAHTLTAMVPSLPFLKTCRLVVIQDDPGHLNQKTFRVLITDVMALSIEQILLIYLRRWKQETYHQIIKDRLGVRSYKHRKLKAIVRLLELADVAYCFLEYRRLNAIEWEPSLSSIRNELIYDFEKTIARTYHFPPPKCIENAA